MKTPNVNKANKYARDVVGLKQPACHWIIRACQRHLDDVRKSKAKDFPFYFDAAEAERVCTFVQMFHHTKGKWAAKKMRLELEPWQLFAIACIFGWRRKKDNFRRFRRVLLLIPRKNGKSALAAAIGLYMLAGDSEYGAEIYSGASSEKQALEVFTPAKIMAKGCEDYLEYFDVEVNASNISILSNGSKFETVIAKPRDGASPSCAIADEVHEHRDSEQIDTMLTGMGARDQPLMLMVTTAGNNIEGPCYAYQLEAQAMLDGTVPDDELFALVYTIDVDDDWTHPATLVKANPNFGISVGEDFLLSQLQTAKNNPRRQSAYKTKHLNVWVGARDAYFNLQRWNESANPDLRLDQFTGQRCYIGLDLASRSDIAAAVLLFPLGNDDFAVFGKYYLPQGALDEGKGDHYQAWQTEGHICVTDGEITDFDLIKDDICAWAKQFDVRELAFDPYQSTMLVTELMKQGLPAVEVRQTTLTFSEPMKHVEGLIKARQIQHDGNPAMSWMMGNVTARENAKEEVYPRKELPENKIDGPVALLMAMSRCIIGDDSSINAAIDGMISAYL